MTINLVLAQTPGTFTQVIAWCPSEYPGHRKWKPGAECVDNHDNAGPHPLLEGTVEEIAALVAIGWEMGSGREADRTGGPDCVFRGGCTAREALTA
jgi:hypothetical protein